MYVPYILWLMILNISFIKMEMWWYKWKNQGPIEDFLQLKLTEMYEIIVQVINATWFKTGAMYALGGDEERPSTCGRSGKGWLMPCE